MSLAPSRDETPTGGPSYDLFVSYAETDRGWVEGYLFDALDAAGIRYVSEAAFELGAPRVAEFERAVRASRRTLLVITPAYLADAYAPFGDLLAQTFGIETGTWPVIPLTLEDAALPPRLAMLVALDASRPEWWSVAVERLCAAVNRPLPAATPAPCPYPGMLPFRERDAARFFGRDAEVAEMVGRLRLHRFLAVIGPSGTGKSSLVLAGLVPALRSSGLLGSGDWRFVTIRPGAAPVDALDLAIGGDLGTEIDSDRLLVVCDQFEETFTIGREQAAEFQARLGRLAEHARCWVVLTVRADFYADLMSSPLWTEVRTHRVEVAPLGDDGLRAAIVRPADAEGVHVDPALVERLVADAAGEPGVLPLVQEALVLSWERLARRYLPLDAYQSIAGEDGSTGLQAAMARRADAALADLPPGHQAIARRVFVRLVQFGAGRADTRRQQRLGELRAAGDDPPEVDQTVDHLVEHRLLTASGAEEGADRRIDLAHEALITGWPTLRGWLAERRDAEQTRRRLDDKAAEWVRLGRGDGGLLDEVELAETERWLAGPDAAEVGFDPALVDLATASRASIDHARAARRRRVRAVIGSLAVGLLVVTALAVWGALSARSARRQEERAREARAVAEEKQAEADTQRAEAEALTLTSRSRQLAADSVTQLDHNLDRAMLLAVQAYRTEPSLQARSASLSALEFSPRVAKILDAGVSTVDWAEITFTDHDRRIAAVLDGVLRQWGATTGAPLATTSLFDDPSSPTAAFSSDGRLLAAENCLSDTGSRCEIQIWDVATRTKWSDPIRAPSPYLNAVAFSPDNRLLAMVDIGSDDPAIHLWDLDAGRPFGAPMRTRARSVAFSPDGKTLASGFEPFSTAGGESSVSLWDVSTQQLLVETPLESLGGVNALAFRSDGTALAAGYGSGNVRVLDASDPATTLFEYKAPVGVFDVQYSPNGASFATASHEDDHLLLWPPGSATPEQLSGHQGQTYDIAFSADSARFASAGSDGRLIVWQAGDDDALRVGGGPLHGDTLSAISFDGESVVTVGRAKPGDVALGAPEFGRWDRRTDESRITALPADGVFAVSPDGRVVAIGDVQGRITQIDSRTGDAAGPTIKAHDGKISALAFSQDGQTLVSSGCLAASEQFFCDDAAELAQWDRASGRAIGSRPTPTSFTHLSLSPDGRTAATSLGGREVWLWDLRAKAQEPVTLEAEDRTAGLAWSPDSRLLAVTGEAGGAHGPSARDQRNQNVTIWDAATASRVGEPLLGHLGDVVAAAFSPDGTVLASGDVNGGIRLWDVETGSPLGQRIVTGPGSVTVLKFSPDGRTLASGHSDGQLRLWDMDPEAWLDRLCAEANRDLTRAEWAEFVGDVEYETTCPKAGS